MRRFTITLFSLMLFLAFGLTQAQANEKAAKFLANDHWKKGNAEYQLYNYNLKWYDAARKTKDSLMILVVEPWNTKLNVKGTPDQYVLKFSMFDQFETGTYNYSIKADMFIDWRGRVIKYVMSVHDGCGANFMRFDEIDGDGKFVWHSYWNDHGKLEFSLSADKYDTFYEALPVYLRHRLDEKSFSFKMIQPVIGNHPPGTTEKKADDIKDYPAIWNGEATVNGNTVSVKHDKGTDVLEFESQFPHALKSWKMFNGFTKELRGSSYIPYWDPKLRGQKAGHGESLSKGKKAGEKKGKKPKKKKG